MPHTCEFSSPERTGCVYGCESQSFKACIYLLKHQRAPYLHSHVRIAVCLYPYVYIMNEKTALSIRFVGNPNDGFPLGASAFPILCCDVINFRGDFGTPSESNKKKNKSPNPIIIQTRIMILKGYLKSKTIPL